MADLPPLTSLRTFWYVAEHESFKRASEHLFVTQAAVSHQIRQLEDFLGVSLFERGNREVRLTKDGQRLLPYVQQGFSALRAGVTLVKDDADPNVINLSVMPAFASRWLVPRLGQFRQLHPEIRLNLKPTQQLETFSDGEMDLAIRYGSGQYPGLRSEFLLRDSLLVVATPDFIAEHTPSLDNLTQLPLLEDTSTDEQGWAEWFRRHNIETAVAERCLTIADASMLVDAAMGGQGVALVRRSLVQHFVDQGALKKLFALELDSPYGYYLVAPEAHFVRAKVKWFMQWMKEEVRQSFGPEMMAYHGA
ncbi:transcriptional regulator GcvA [Salinispirillum marinum]|uniref:Transcriptional regulator GcvA n=2 Tax=Saccharospirillaceae TaxID=255527 RepID=A0ABV8BK88_9GAMM